MSFDGTQFGKDIVGIVKEFVGERLSPIVKRIDALEARAPEKGEKGTDGDRGEKGEPGEAAPAPTREQIVEAIMSMPDVLDAAVQRHLSDNPPPAGQDGADGRDGQDGAPGVDGKDGKDGADGCDGVGLAGAVIDRDGNLILTMTDGSTKDMGVVVGRDGKKGVDGRDGFSLDDFDADLMDDGRTVLLSFEQGDIKHVVELGIPAAIYRGVFKEGEAYVRGDMVTFGGSVWHCDAETTAKPGEEAGDWTLAVKRGRDGKNGILKAEKPKGPLSVGKGGKPDA